MAKSSTYWSEIPTRDEADLGSDGEAEGMDEEPTDAETAEADAADPPDA